MPSPASHSGCAATIALQRSTVTLVPATTVSRAAFISVSGSPTESGRTRSTHTTQRWDPSESRIAVALVGELLGGAVVRARAHDHDRRDRLLLGERLRGVGRRAPDLRDVGDVAVREEVGEVGVGHQSQRVAEHERRLRRREHRCGRCGGAGAVRDGPDDDASAEAPGARRRTGLGGGAGTATGEGPAARGHEGQDGGGSAGHDEGRARAAVLVAARDDRGRLRGDVVPGGGDVRARGALVVVGVGLVGVDHRLRRGVLEGVDERRGVPVPSCSPSTGEGYVARLSGG